jgi:hypothetical protein
MEDHRARNPVSGWWRSLTREQKLSVGVLGVCGVIAITLSVVRLRSLITRPFTTPVQLLVDLKRKNGPSEQDRIEASKHTDTDGDGISDYDESNVYHTSPYLKDSDSDGVPDNIEIARGTDPNCAEGKVCLSTVSGTEAATGTSATFTNGPDSGVLMGSGSPSPIPSAPLPTRDPAAIRAFLKQGGTVSNAELSSYSDQDLLDAYDQLMAERGPAASTSTTDNTQASPAQ